MPGVTFCRNAETGGEAELPTDALDAWGAHGWEPVTGESRSLQEAEAQKVDAANAAALVDTPPVLAEPAVPVSAPAESIPVEVPPSPGSLPDPASVTPAGDAGNTTKEK